MWLACCSSISCVGLGELAPSLEAGILWSMETATINYKIGNEKLIRVLDAASAKLRALLDATGSGPRGLEGLGDRWRMLGASV